MAIAQEQFGICLRQWRERLTPADAGMPVRLEQGPASNPSELVLAALARALRLGADERSHLYRRDYLLVTDA